MDCRLLLVGTSGSRAPNALKLSSRMALAVAVVCGRTDLGLGVRTLCDIINVSDVLSCGRSVVP